MSCSKNTVLVIVCTLSLILASGCETICVIADDGMVCGFRIFDVRRKATFGQAGSAVLFQEKFAISEPAAEMVPECVEAIVKGVVKSVCPIP